MMSLEHPGVTQEEGNFCRESKPSSGHQAPFPLECSPPSEPVPCGHLGMNTTKSLHA